MIDHPEDYAGPTEPCGDLSAAPFGSGEPCLPNCAVECEALCQMSTRGYCERARRPLGGWSDSGSQEGV